jgi:C4-dicarboxylate-binding protein DctP
MKSWKKLALLSSMMLAATMSNGASAAPIIIKFSHVVANNTPKGAAALKFAQLAAKYTHNRVKVQVYPNSTLYKDGEEMNAIQLGSVQMLAPSLSKFGPLGAREFEVFDLPFLFSNEAALHRVEDGPIGKGLMQKLQPKGIVGLAYWDNGFKDFTSNKPIAKLSDYRGQKMRIQSSKLLEAQMRALGVMPQVMAFSEVYTGLQTGVVDGTENTPSNTYTQKVNEVQKYMALTNHGYIGYGVIVNKKFWDGLPADIRSELTRAMNEATAFERASADRDNSQALAAIKKAGHTRVFNVAPSELAAMKAKMKPVYARFQYKGLLSQVEKTVGH